MNYLKMLSLFGIGGAHPGGLSLTKNIFESEQVPLNINILDAGCGTGQTASYLYQLGYTITGLDIDPLMIEHAQMRNQQLDFEIPYLNEDLSHTSLPANTFDLILSESVLNFTSLSKTLPEISRILKPNGLVVAIEMIRKAPLSTAEENELKSFYGCNGIFSVSEWERQFTENGFIIYKVLQEEDIFLQDLGEPSTEFSPVKALHEDAFMFLSEHEKISIKYSNKLSFSVFLARKIAPK
ncbi:class I SAM-dependent methyltransferase [Bacillus sp. SA1-12]|uniref:class I SAM-dependent methyltransferase n=1 Tax=Bacillus sp. SA1-12 TaxID=1455638 RepID=UPI0006973759|nr:class I SAM-dependent methyltransferase [Bacillus sp. SA1-12]